MSRSGDIGARSDRQRHSQSLWGFAAEQSEASRHERSGQSGTIVKFCLTAGQGLRLLCIGGRCNLSTVRAIQSTENAHEQRNSWCPDRAGAVCRRRHDRFGSCYSVCDAGRVVRDTGALKLFCFLIGDVDSEAAYSSLD